MAIKIIKEGKVEEPAIYRSVCLKCGCVFEFSSEDSQEDKWSKVYDFRFLPCPYCGKMVFNYDRPINK